MVAALADDLVQIERFQRREDAQWHRDDANRKKFRRVVNFEHVAGFDVVAGFERAAVLLYAPCEERIVRLTAPLCQPRYLEELIDPRCERPSRSFQFC